MRRSIVIVFDSLPAHWLGCYGNFDVETPAFDWLATQSIVFDRHVADSPGGSVAVESLLTGKYAALESSAAIPALTRPDQIGEKLALAESGVVWLWMDTAMERPAETDDDIELYRDVVDQCDEVLLESLEQIETAGWFDALLVVTALGGSDQNGFTAEGRDVSDVPNSLTGYGFTDLRLPLIVRHPQVAGFRLQSITQPVDLVPTLCDWSGEDISDADLDGISLLPLISGDRERIRDHGFFSNQTHVGIVVDDFILVRRRHESARPELFLQPHDRWMIHDVAVEYPGVVDELGVLLDEWIA